MKSLQGLFIVAALVVAGFAPSATAFQPSRNDTSGLITAIGPFPNTSAAVSVFNAFSGSRYVRIGPFDERPNFGIALALDGSFLAIGEFDADAPGVTAAGAVFLYDITVPTDPVELAVLRSDTPVFSGQFGASLALHDGLLAVGSPFDEDMGQSSGCNSGAVYLFEIDGGSATQIARLTGTGLNCGDGFGAEVAIDDGLLAVGVPNDSNNGLGAGAVYVFDVTDPSLPVQTEKVLEPGGSIFHAFGSSVRVSGSRLAVGAAGAPSIGGAFLGGRAYVVETAGITTVTPLDGGVNDFNAGFGGSVAIVGDLCAVGVPRVSTDGGRGAVQLFDVSDPMSPVLSDVIEAVDFENIGGWLSMTDEILVAPDSDKSFQSYELKCRADVNDDGLVDPGDFTAWLGCFSEPSSAPFCPRADVNKDGAVSPVDFTAWLGEFNAGCD